MANTSIVAPQEFMPASVLTSQALMEHWQGHRHLTRLVIEKFPDEPLFHFSKGGIWHV